MFLVPRIQSEPRVDEVRFLALQRLFQGVVRIAPGRWARRARFAEIVYAIAVLAENGWRYPVVLVPFVRCDAFG